MWKTKYCNAYYDIVSACNGDKYNTYKPKSVMSVSSSKFTAH